LVPASNVVCEVERHETGLGWTVHKFGAGAAVVNDEIFKVRQHADRKTCRPGVAAQLIGALRVALDVDRRTFGLDEVLALTPQSKAIVWRFGGQPNSNRNLVDDL